MTTCEVELGGTKLPKDAHLLVLYASGNDDESQFECPRNFDLTRSNLARHVAFGVGVHRCIGASLARMEIKVAARELVRSEEHTSELQSLMRISYAVFCLKKKRHKKKI